MDTRFDRREFLRFSAFAGLASAASTSTFVNLAFAAGESVNIITSNSTLTNTLIQMLLQKKYDADFGIEAKVTKVTDNSQVIPSLISGEMDMATIVAFNGVFPAMSKGAKLKIIGGSSMLYQAAIYAKDPAIKTLKDLEGKVMGSGAIGAAVHMLTTLVLAKNGVDVSKVQFRNIGSNAAIFKAVAGGTIAAGASGIDVYDQQEKYGVHVPEHGNFWEEIPDYTYQTAYTSERAIAKKRDGLVKALAAFAKLYRYVQSPESRDDFVKAYAAATGQRGGHEAEALSQWNFLQKYKPYSEDIVVSEARMNYVQEVNVRFHTQKTVLPFSQVADMSLAEDAVKLLGAKT